jgi:SAM-dependent methyltransferase
MRLKPRLRKVPGYRVVRFVYNMVHTVESRNAALLLLWPPKGLYQPYGTTSDDRYPEIFQFVREKIGDSKDVSILSIGCSTGEEIFSLRRYFPHAKLIGLDINPLNILACRFRRRRNGDRNMHFAIANSTSGQADASHDAIFAMAVYRHGDLKVAEPPSKCDHRIRFADFERSVTDLARCLKPGGLLVIEHAMFRFADASVASQFSPSFRWESHEKEPTYDRYDCILRHANYHDVVFCKSV